jgi:hypothetical protein
VQLTLDHLIIRSAEPRETLSELTARAGTPVLAEVEEVGGLASGIVRAGAVDLEVLRIGATPPPREQGYGLGFTADVPLAEASAALRELGLPTSGAVGASASGRSWRAVHVHGLLPDPFPLPVTTRRPKPMDRLSERLAGRMAKIPAVARAATRKAGSSMIVLTEYDFDVAAWRAAAGAGPDVLAVEVGTGGGDWSGLPLAAGPLRLLTDRLPGILRVVLKGDREPFALGDVRFEFSSAA